MNAEKIVKSLTDFPHRATCGQYAEEVLQYLISVLPEISHTRQNFKTPKNYLVIITWLILGIISGIIISIFLPVSGIFFTGIFVVFSFLFFNWYPSPASNFPPLSTSDNLIFKKTNTLKNTHLKRIILMAHWDTAPISILYKPEIVGNFRTSLKINLVLMAATFLWTVLNYFIEDVWVVYIGIILILYFSIQLVVASWDFFKHGYSNGASDNATGVAAAINTAKNCWEMKLENTEIELVLTGAEELGMIGAKEYFKKNAASFDKNTFLINFDTLGAGDLIIITETGTIGTVKYNNILVDIAKQIVQQNHDLTHITSGAWHTADFDSVWFNRAGMATLTLAALDKNGKMPNIHRETDLLQNVDFKPMHDAILLATAIVKKLDKV